ncbi:hypothetical protein ACVWZZ_001445 [Bradyrhizobium sp. LM6.10]|jgi:hypothetical protein
MNLPEFGCDFLIARCIEEVAQDRVCAGMHVTALLTMVLERLKSPNRFFLTHYWAFGCGLGQCQHFKYPSVMLGP